MKNKKLKYILLPLVAIVWGLVVYRIFFENRTKPENLTQIIKPIVKEEVKKKDNSYKLIANYPDPFLDKASNSQNVGAEEKQKDQSESNANLRRRRTSVSRVRWPEIKYGGFVESNKAKQTILIQINKRDYLAYKGDTIEQVIVREFYGDSLIVVFSNEEKTIMK